MELASDRRLEYGPAAVQHWAKQQQQHLTSSRPRPAPAPPPPPAAVLFIVVVPLQFQMNILACILLSAGATIICPNRERAGATGAGWALRCAVLRKLSCGPPAPRRPHPFATPPWPGLAAACRLHRGPHLWRPRLPLLRERRRAAGRRLGECACGLFCSGPAQLAAAISRPPHHPLDCCAPLREGTFQETA